MIYILNNSRCQTHYLQTNYRHNLIEGKTQYDYVYIPDDLSQTIDIKSVNPGSIEKIGIETGGILYNVGDIINFDNTNTCLFIIIFNSSLNRCCSSPSW